jgi:hypothetical protein
MRGAVDQYVLVGWWLGNGVLAEIIALAPRFRMIVNDFDASIANCVSVTSVGHSIAQPCR